MKIYKDIAKLPKFENAVLTIGTFDGVHKGHCKIIEQIVEEAIKIGGTPVVITFYPHPKLVVATTKNKLNLLTTQSEKYKLLEEKGVGAVVEVPFDKAFAEQSAAAYIDGFLIDKFAPHTIVIGYDHRFGKNREGNFKLLEEKARVKRVNVIEIAEKLVEDITISSTKVRDALLDGDPKTAETYLGYPYFFTGKVVEGNKLGRTIGYPTANLALLDEGKLVPGNGVYSVDVLVEGDEPIYKGMMNIGMRPTVDGTKRMIEVNIFDFDKMIYGKNITVRLKKRIRDEQKFDGLDALKKQLAQDKKAAQK